MIAIYALITIAVIFALYFIYQKCNSNKKQYRDEGIIALKSQNYEVALADFQKSLDEDQWFTEKMDIDTRMYIGLCYMRLEQYQAASDTYKGLLAEKDADVDTALVGALLETAESSLILTAVSDGKTTALQQETIDMLKQYAGEDPQLNLYLASAHIRNEQYEEACGALEEYLKHFEVNTYVAYELSASYLRSGNTAAATEMIDKGLQAADGIYTDLLQYNRVIVLETEGKYEEAFSLIEKLYKEYPDNEDMKREYTFLDSRVHPDTVPVNPDSDANY